MAGELFCKQTGDTSNLYCVLRRASDSYVWQTSTSTWVVWSNGGIANYDIALASAGGDLYTADMPSGVGGSTIMRVTYYEYTVNGVPAITDLPLSTRTITGTGASGSAPAGSSGYLTLAEWRSIVIDSVLMAQNSYIGDYHKIDRAILGAGNRFVRETKCTAVSANITITSGTEAVDCTATATDFLPQSFMLGEIGYYKVRFADYEQIRASYENSTSTGRPTYIGFRTPAQGVLYPQPDTGYTMRLTYYQPFTYWTPAQADDTILLNIPARWAHDVAWFGVGTQMQYGETAQGSLYAEKGLSRFMELIKEAKGAFSLDSYDSIMDNAGV